jgi:hypothetical protein
MERTGRRICDPDPEEGPEGERLRSFLATVLLAGGVAVGTASEANPTKVRGTLSFDAMREIATSKPKPPRSG